MGNLNAYVAAHAFYPSCVSASDVTAACSSGDELAYGAATEIGRSLAGFDRLGSLLPSFINLDEVAQLQIRRRHLGQPIYEAALKDNNVLKITFNKTRQSYLFELIKQDSDSILFSKEIEYERLTKMKEEDTLSEEDSLFSNLLQEVKKQVF